MSRAVLILNSNTMRDRAIHWINNAPPGTRLEFKAPRRSTEQNARFWAMLTDIARQVEWHGKKLSADDWKLIFLDGLKREVRVAPNLDGDGFVNLGTSSSDLSKAEMGDLMTLMEMFGAKHGVTFHDPKEAA